MSSATKKFALATLPVPVLAALAIGLAGSAVAAPARPQPSDTGATTTRGQEKRNYGIGGDRGYNNMIGCAFCGNMIGGYYNMIGNLFGTTDQQPTSKTVRKPQRATSVRPRYTGGNKNTGPDLSLSTPDISPLFQPVRRVPLKSPPLRPRDALLP
jgi:hypothetical protein